MDQLYSEIELPLEAVLADIENAGMKVDGEQLKGILGVYFGGTRDAERQDLCDLRPRIQHRLSKTSRRDL